MTTTDTLATLATAYAETMRDIALAESALLAVACRFTAGEDAGLSWRGMSAASRDAGHPMSKDRAQDLALLGRYVATADTSTHPARGSLRDLLDMIGNARRYLGAATVRESIADWADRDDDERTLEDLRDVLSALDKAATAERKRRQGATTATVQETAQEGETPQEETPAAPTRGNGALISDAMAALSRVDALTMTDAEAAALSALIKQATATGRAWQAAQAATKAA